MSFGLEHVFLQKCIRFAENMYAMTFCVSDSSAYLIPFKPLLHWLGFT